MILLDLSYKCLRSHLLSSTFEQLPKPWMCSQYGSSKRFPQEISIFVFAFTPIYSMV
jgi:hypothetical protein